MLRGPSWQWYFVYHTQTFASPTFVHKFLDHWSILLERLLNLGMCSLAYLCWCDDDEPSLCSYLVHACNILGDQSFVWLLYFRGKKCYEPPKYMTINTAIDQLLEVEEMHKECGMFIILSLLWSHVIIHLLHLLRSHNILFSWPKVLL